ncbi:GIY-YIG nuclease family protein [Leptolyngbya sp. FACHB-36]|uniref:GIY-YIG nuclease family protein n=1 Tax=Leptolyngbya sp. FACHB-36 TaxID=2692808 RepID=UPI0016809352|nr:GIY-YIG nuclease family protein [Leptolyngbya sp. FACHB-36]MBD2019194.1 GIY-YIG nuclease family protein [Leptolyngbya sp. FACHB-36]
MNPKRSGFVYLIRAGRGNLYKIGVAIDPTRRLAQLQTGSPHRLSLVAAKRYRDPYQRESTLHRQYRAYRVRDDGEWFRLPFWVAWEVKREIAGTIGVWTWLGLIALCLLFYLLWLLR